jgi:mannose-6-phosphate isomerase-like protein (cupin superfamily)
MATRAPILDLSSMLARTDELIASHGARPWSETVIMNDDMQAFFICQDPGHPTDTHYHLHEEWWVILKGEVNWYMGDSTEPIRAKEGDIVLAPALVPHHIEPVGTSVTVRLGINTRGEFHRHDKPGCTAKLWRTETGFPSD